MVSNCVVIFMDFTLAFLYLGEIPPNLVAMFKGVGVWILVRNAQGALCMCAHACTSFVWYIFVN